MSGDRRVRVQVPASTANLGSGFDVLGLALGLYNTVEMEAIPQGIELTVTGGGGGGAGGGGGGARPPAPPAPPPPPPPRGGGPRARGPPPTTPPRAAKSR